jgi:hypothetical protein
MKGRENIPNWREWQETCHWSEQQETCHLNELQETVTEVNNRKHVPEVNGRKHVPVLPKYSTPRCRNFNRFVRYAYNSRQEKKWTLFGRTVSTITTYLQHYRAQWKSHIERTTDTRRPKLITSYKPPGKRSLGRRLKRWSETVTDHQDQNEKGWWWLLDTRLMQYRWVIELKY